MDQPKGFCVHCKREFVPQYGYRNICEMCDEYFECRRGHSFCTRHQECLASLGVLTTNTTK